MFWLTTKSTLWILFRAYPQCLKDAQVWARKGKECDLCWTRHSPVLELQWIDSKPVSMLTTLYSANDQVTCKRKTKQQGVYSELTIPQHRAIHKYNQFMNGVDKSDQMLSYHNISRKCIRWWKTLFFHLIDIAVANSFILFQRYRAEHSEVEALRRQSKYSVGFREALVRQIVGWQEYNDPPAYGYKAPGNCKFETVHMPKVSECRRQCAVCYKEGRGQLRVNTYCNAPQCQKYLHISSSFNCCETWHSPGYMRWLCKCFWFCFRSSIYC